MPAAAPSAAVEKPVALVSSVPATAAPTSRDPGRTPNSAFQQALDALHAIPVNHLFNGRDLSGFYTYLGPSEPGAAAVGKNKDPDHVFVVKNGVLEISGKHMGALTTTDEYENYLLTVEYRWGTRTYRPRNGQPKFGAIGFHSFGPDGAWRGEWMRGYRARLDENGGGDLGLSPNTVTEPHASFEVEPIIVMTAKKTERTNHVYKPGSSVREFTAGSHVLRLGTINNTVRYTPGTPAGTIWEKPSGEWNTIEILCVGDTFGIIFNGTLVNSASKTSHTRGKIQLASDRADIFFKTVDLRSVPRGYAALPGMPKPSAPRAIAKVTATRSTQPDKKSSQVSEPSSSTKTKAKSRSTRTPPKN